MDAGPSAHVSIVIPHLRGRDILLRCLSRLAESESYLYSLEILVVDNASSDGSVAAAKDAFPAVVVLTAARNLGYAGACNWGMRQARGEFVVLLNDDTEVTPGWLEPLLACLRQDEKIAACQPKIRAINPPELFDYAGASGGYLDVFGFPFARGRIFYTIEKDLGQYDDACDVFWTSGACMMVRRSALEGIGLLDEDFFAHMEEIDLCWRLQLAGYRLRVVPVSCVRHQSGSTLQPWAPQKVYLNHRNNLTMLLKNYSWRTLLWVFPARLVFELVIVCAYLVQMQLSRAAAVMRALAHVWLRLPAILQKRRAVQNLRRCSDQVLWPCLYHRSIVIDYFLRHLRRFAELRGLSRLNAPGGLRWW